MLLSSVISMAIRNAKRIILREINGASNAKEPKNILKSPNTMQREAIIHLSQYWNTKRIIRWCREAYHWEASDAERIVNQLLNKSEENNGN